MDTNHAVVDAALLDDEGSDGRVAFQPTRARDLEPAGRDDVAADKSRERDARAADVRLHMCLRPDPEVTVGLDLPAEVAEDLSSALEGQLPRQGVFAGQYRRFRVQAQRIWAPVRVGRQSGLHGHLRHVPIPPRPPSPQSEAAPFLRAA